MKIEGTEVRKCDCLTCALKNAASDWHRQHEGRTDDAVNSNNVLNSMALMAAEILLQECPDMLTLAMSAAAFGQAVINNAQDIAKHEAGNTVH